MSYQFFYILSDFNPLFTLQTFNTYIIYIHNMQTGSIENNT